MLHVANLAVIPSIPSILTLSQPLTSIYSSALSALIPYSPFLVPSTPFSILQTVSSYMLTANIVYLSRRSYVRNMSKRKLLQIRTSREPNTSLRFYTLTLLSWQCFVAVFPLVELLTTLLFHHVSFFYSYPNAHGVGIVFEPVTAQSDSISKRTKQQIRLDWHRFQVNVGDIGRDGYRHPPSKTLNLPHLDIPKQGMKHWPWRRRVVTKMPSSN